MLRSVRQIRINNVFWTGSEDNKAKKTEKSGSAPKKGHLNLVAKLANIVIEMPKLIMRHLKQEAGILHSGRTFFNRLGVMDENEDDNSQVFDGVALQRRSRKKWWQSNSRRKVVRIPVQSPDLSNYENENDDYDYDFIPSMKNFENYYKGYYNRNKMYDIYNNYPSSVQDHLSKYREPLTTTTTAPYIETLKKVTNQKFNSQSFDDLIQNHKLLIENSIKKIKSSSTKKPKNPSKKSKRNSVKSTKSKSELKVSKAVYVKKLQPEASTSESISAGRNTTTMSKIQEAFSSFEEIFSKLKDNLLSIFISTNTTDTEDHSVKKSGNDGLFDGELYIIEDDVDDSDDDGRQEPKSLAKSDSKKKQGKLSGLKKDSASEKSDYYHESYFDMLYALLDLRSLAHKIVDPIDKFIEQKIVVEPLKYMHPDPPYPLLPVSTSSHYGDLGYNSIPLPPPRPKPLRFQYDQPSSYHFGDSFKRYFSELLSWDRSSTQVTQDPLKCKYSDKVVCEYLEKKQRLEASGSSKLK